MIGSTGFDDMVQRALRDVHAATDEPSGLADRLIANLDSPRPVVPLHRPTRRWAVPLLAAAAVVAMVSGIAVATVVKSSSHSPVGNPTPTDSAPVTASSDAPTISSSPSATPTASPPTSPPAIASTALTEDEVMNATIDIPSLPAGIPLSDKCPSGSRKFTNGEDVMTLPGQNLDGIGFDGRPLIADVTGDGLADAIVLFDCSLHQRGAMEILLLVGDATGGVHVQATIAATADPSSVGFGGYPTALRSANPSAIVVRWADQQMGSSATQDRTYTSANGNFKQTTGPSVFANVSSQISVSVATVKITPIPDHPLGYSGTMTVLIHNAGPGPAQKGSLVLSAPPASWSPGYGVVGVVGIPAGVTGLPDSRGDNGSFNVNYALPTIATGATLTVTFDITLASYLDQLPTQVTISAQASTTDPAPSDNTANIVFTL